MNPPADQTAIATLQALQSGISSPFATTETPKEAPADAISVLASMLTGIAAPAQQASPEAGTATTDALPTAADSVTDPAAMIAPAMPITMPINLPATTTDAAGGPAITAQPDAKASTAAANVAAGSIAKTEGPAETGKLMSEAALPTSEASKFATLFDAARTGQPVTSGDEAALAKIVATAAETAAAAATHATAAPARANAGASSASPSTTIATPVGADGWGREVGEKLSWMVGRREMHAELVLNPPQMGRVEVSITLNGDHANATFVSANPSVRDALENAMPHLRETLQSAGISLGQTQVGAESFQQAANQRENGDNRRGGNADDGKAAGTAASGETTPAGWLRRGNGLVDTFA